MSSGRVTVNCGRSTRANGGGVESQDRKDGMLHLQSPKSWLPCWLWHPLGNHLQTDTIPIANFPEYLGGWSLRKLEGAGIELSSVQLVHKFAVTLSNTMIHKSGARGLPQFLKKRSENAGANENLSGGFAAIPGIAPRVAPRIVGFVLIKSWEAILRMEFRIPRMEFPIPRAAPRIPRNSPRAPRMAFSLRERFSWNWGGPQASEQKNQKW